jgi:hypothetical protein
MVSGLNMLIRVHRMTQITDDQVGGARISGTSTTDYHARMQASPDEQLLLQQGLETVRMFTLIVSPGCQDIRERDEIEIIAPTDHPYYSKRFRVVSMRHSDFNPRDPRNYSMLTVTRSVQSHANQ